MVFLLNPKFQTRAPAKLDKYLPVLEKKKEAVVSEWDKYTDPEEKRRAILAKHGLRGSSINVDKDDEIDDILNYEDKDDMKEYEKMLKQRYFLTESDEITI